MLEHERAGRRQLDLRRAARPLDEALPDSPLDKRRDLLADRGLDVAEARPGAA